MKLPWDAIAVSYHGLCARDRIALNLALLATLLALLLAPLPEGVESSPVFGALANAFHGVLFAGVSLILVLRNGVTSLRSYISPMIIAAGLAAGTELLQSIGPRDPSWEDLATDLLGIFAATTITALWMRKQLRLSGPHHAAIALLGLSAILLMLTPCVEQILRWSDRMDNFPLLFSGDLRGAVDMTESLGELDEVAITREGRSIDVALLSGPTPGLVITEFVPDWRNYQALVFDLGNPTGHPLALEVHVRDRVSSSEPTDRFNLSTTLRAGARSTLRIPLAELAQGPIGRRMRMNAIKLMAIYRIQPGGERFVIHAIRLE